MYHSWIQQATHAGGGGGAAEPGHGGIFGTDFQHNSCHIFQLQVLFFRNMQVEAEVLRYLGTVAPRQDSAPRPERPIRVLSPPREERHVRWHLQASPCPVLPCPCLLLLLSTQPMSVCRVPGRRQGTHTRVSPCVSRRCVGTCC